MGISWKCSNSGLWVGRGPISPPPIVLWSKALRILCGAFHPRAAPAQGCRRSHVSPVYAGPETSHAYPETYTDGSYSCGGINIGCHPLPGLICQYLTPACGWPPLPGGEPPWPPRGLHHVGSLSLGTREWDSVWWLGCGVTMADPPLALLQHGGTSLSLQVAPQGRQDVFDGLFHLVRPTGQWARQPFE